MVEISDGIPFGRTPKNHPTLLHGLQNGIAAMVLAYKTDQGCSQRSRYKWAKLGKSSTKHDQFPPFVPIIYLSWAGG